MIEWRRIPGFTKYKVSDDGRVWSSHVDKELAQFQDKKGYIIVRLVSNKKGYMRRAHRLVAMAFLSCDNSNLLVNHIDGNKQNNHLSNLEWVTAQQNAIHSAYVLGNAQPVSKETQAKIIEARRNGMFVKDILAKFKISNVVYRRIVKPPKEKRSWKQKELPLKENEIIKEIPSWPFYYASNLGNIYSMKSGKSLAQHQDQYGYMSTHLCQDGIAKNLSVHRLIAITFFGNAPLGKNYVNHIDENPTNNTLDNLEWVSRSENISHSVKKLRKLTTEQCTTIRELYTTGKYRLLDIATLYNVHTSTIGKIITRKHGYEKR